MKAHWWSCVLGLLCMPAEVVLDTWTASQGPPSISLTRVNSSAEITCSTSLTDPLGLRLYRRFKGEGDIVFLSLNQGQVIKNTPNAAFEGRIQVAPVLQIREGYGFTLQLSLLGLDDTDLYYCTWNYYESKTKSLETLHSDGTVIVVGESDHQEQCRNHILDVTLTALSVTAFAIVLLFFIGALIMRCRRFKKLFRPARAEQPARPNRPQHVCPQQRNQHYPYLITSVNPLDFRGIL